MLLSHGYLETFIGSSVMLSTFSFLKTAILYQL